MARDWKDNRRGCFLIAAIVSVLLAALAWGILSTDDDPRSNGIVTPGAAPQPAPAGTEPRKSD